MTSPPDQECPDRAYDRQRQERDDDARLRDTLEERHIRRLRKKGWTDAGQKDRNLNSWLRGWRMVGRAK